MDGQMTIDEWLQNMEWTPENPKPCDCGSRNLWMRTYGRGVGNYASYPPTYEGYAYRIFCLDCGRHSWDECHWIRTRKEDAWKDWNFNPRKKIHNFDWILSEKRREDWICSTLGPLY